MGKANKWVGGGRTGDSASGGSKVDGGNAPYNPGRDTGPKAKPLSRRISDETRPGETGGKEAISSHNDISRFTSGIRSRGQYRGPSFESLNHYKQGAQAPNPQSISRFELPSGGTNFTSRGSVVGGQSTAKGSSNDRVTSQRNTNMSGRGINRGRGTGSGGAGYGRR